MLATIFLEFSQIYATIGGEMIESGFPLHYKLDVFCVPMPQEILDGCSSYSKIYYKNLIIDILFWLIISYILICLITWIFDKITKRRNK